jgi:hypothetical protein
MRDCRRLLSARGFLTAIRDAWMVALSDSSRLAAVVCSVGNDADVPPVRDRCRVEPSLARRRQSFPAVHAAGCRTC